MKLIKAGAILSILIYLVSCATVRNDLPMNTAEERRESALVILGNPPGTFPVDSSDIPRLLEYSRDPNPAVRHMAVYQLGQLRTNSFFDEILPLLVDEDLSVSRNTENLILRDKSAALKVLRRALESGNEVLILKALDLLVSLNDRESLPQIIELFLSGNPDVFDKSVSSAAKIASLNDRILFDSLLRPETELRVGIVRTLSRMGDPSVLGTLLPYFYDPDIRVQNAVKFAFIDFGKDSLPYLINVLNNPAPRTQLAVLGLFEALQIPDSLPPMIGLFADDNQRVRERAVYTVSTFGEIAREPLGEALKDDKPEIIINSIILLERIGDPDSLLYLMSVLNHQNQEIRNRAFESVLSFGTDAGDQFLRILDRREEELYRFAVKGLMKIGDIRLVLDNRASLYNRNNRNRALVFFAEYEELEEYLKSLSLSGLVERDFLFIKEIYTVAEKLIRAEKEIGASGSRYTTFYISRNDFLLKSEEALKLSFAHMHNYMESRNPDDLKAAKTQQEESEMFQNAADNLTKQLEDYIGSTEEEELLIQSFESSRSRIVELYESVSINRKNLADDILQVYGLTFSDILSGNFGSN